MSYTLWEVALFLSGIQQQARWFLIRKTLLNKLRQITQRLEPYLTHQIRQVLQHRKTEVTIKVQNQKVLLWQKLMDQLTHLSRLSALAE